MTRSFLQRFSESCDLHSQRTAMRVVGIPSETYSYKRLFTEVCNVAAHLREFGVAKGDRVAVFGENHPCWAVSYLAILYAGAVCVPVDPHGETTTIANFLSDSEAKLVFTSAESLERLPEIEEKLGRGIVKIVWRSGDPLNGESFESWAENAAGKAIEPDAAGTDNALLIYTSGTTGRPKGVLLSHANICAELDAVDRVLEVSPQERILSLLPLFHAYLQIAALWIASTKGCEVIYLKELTPEELSKAMKESRMTILASVPRLWYLIHKKIFDEVRRKGRGTRSLFSSLLRINGFLRDAISLNLGRLFFRPVHESLGGELRLAIAAGSRFDEDVAKDFHRLGFTILQAYGLTETSGAATATPITDNRVGSVGKPVLGAKVKIAGGGDSEGEVLIKGPMVFGGYYRNPEATREAFDDDGWFRSGDLGRFDKDGHLYITGRAKDVIVLPSGKNVHPEDLEVHYLKSPLVAEICVIGLTDDREGHRGAEKLAAVTVPDFDFLKKKAIANAKEAIRFDLDSLGRDLPEYQRVRDYIIRTEPLPRTATNKIKRFELRETYSNGDRPELNLALSREWTFDEEARRMMNSPEGRLVVDALVSQRAAVSEIHPEMNFEIDLRLDSLARAELFAQVEQACGREFDGDQVASALTVRDAVRLLSAGGPVPESNSSGGFKWGSILETTEELQPETRAIIKRRTFFPIFAFAVLKSFYLFCRVFLRLKVEGIHNLQQTDKPFLICPNHQSYLDAFVVCSTYPYSVLKDIFHVGASEYFEGTVTRRLASLLNIVPIDPDTHLLKAMKAGAGGLKRGKILNIYPEGERTFDGRLHSFKDGAAILSAELGLPIVPVALDGLYKVWGRGSGKIHAGRVAIRFGEPIAPPAARAGMNGSVYKEHARVVRSAIEVMLEELRG